MDKKCTETLNIYFNYMKTIMKQDLLKNLCHKLNDIFIPSVVIIHLFYVDEWTNQRRSNDYEKHAPHGSVCVRLLQPENQQTDVTAQGREADKGKAVPGYVLIYVQCRCTCDPIYQRMVILDCIYFKASSYIQTLSLSTWK